MGCSRETIANLHAWFLTDDVNTANCLTHSFTHAITLYWVLSINELSKT